LAPVAIRFMPQKPSETATPQFVVYSDETNWNAGRFRAVGMLSMPVAMSRVLGPKIQGTLAQAFGEAKWSKLKSRDRAVCALAAFDTILAYAVTGEVRVDVLCWDIQDSRHSVRGRHDTANRSRMHYHLYSKVMERWPTGQWSLHPDRHVGIDWATLSETLTATARRPGTTPRLLPVEGVPTIRELRQRDSWNAPLVQLADLFAGMVAYSREAYPLGAALRQERQGQLLLVEDNSAPHASNRDQARWSLIDEFVDLCRTRKLGVSLNTYGGLRTMAPSQPVNFWWWTSQGSYDRAPTTSDNTIHN